MDAYTLTRMFRKYPDKQHIDSFKSIVYAGNAHIETYIKFFETVLGASFIKYEPNLEVIKNKNFTDLTRCIDVNLSYFL